jgi:L-amino acid N-acyltransferase YncA
MARTAVRRVNEWDGPSMLKVYTPYTGTTAAPEREAPDLQAYVRRIDRYTYGLGWLLCEIDHQTVGFCHLSEGPAAPEDLFTVEFQLYVKQGMCRRHIGAALWELMRDMLEMGNRRRVVCRVHRENQAALAFFQAMGFVPLEGEPPEEPEKLWLAYHLRPWDPAAPKPTKPYLVEAADYEAAREKAAALVDVSGLE